MLNILKIANVQHISSDLVITRSNKKKKKTNFP